jgi:hypothetical protein
MMPASATAAVPWMSSLKTASGSAVAIEQAEGVGVGEVFELDQRAGEDLGHGRHEFFDERVVGRPADAPLVEADVERIVEQRGLSVPTSSVTGRQ